MMSCDECFSMLKEKLVSPSMRYCYEKNEKLEISQPEKCEAIFFAKESNKTYRM